MASYITVDGGTTNTRLFLWEEGKMTASLSLPLGARTGLTDKEALPREMRKAIASLLEKCKGSVTKILASGMITSESGLCPLPHILAPAGVAELHAAMHEVTLPEISEIPFVFLRGVKISDGTLAGTDMMRGEETETQGTDAGKDALLILPGSHSKLIRTDEAGRISHFETLLSGEMMWALAKDTILADSFAFGACTCKENALLDGYRYARARGVNAALFKVRVLRNLCGGSEDDAYSFFMGATLADEIAEVLRLSPSRIVIGGKAAIREPMATILSHVTSIPVSTLTDEEVALAPARGAIRIYEYGTN